MKNYFYCVVILVCSFTTTKAQENVQWPEFKNYQPFSDYVHSQFMSDTGLRFAGCSSFLSSIKFIVSEKGFIADVIVSESTPTNIAYKLQSIVRSTHGNWKPMKINGQAVVSQPMVLFIYFELEGECNINNKRKSNNNSISIRDLLTFDSDTAVSSMENIKLFKPIYIYTSPGFVDPKQNEKKDDN